MLRVRVRVRIRVSWMGGVLGLGDDKEDTIDLSAACTGKWCSVFDALHERDNGCKICVTYMHFGAL